MAGCGSTWPARWLTRSAPIRWPASTTASRPCASRSGGAEVVGEPDSGHSEEVPALGGAVPGRLAVLQGLAGQAGEGELGMDLNNAVVGMANPSVDLPDLVAQGEGLLRNALPG